MKTLKTIGLKLGLNKNKYVLNAYHKILRIVKNLPDHDVIIEFYGGKAKVWNPSRSGMGRSLFLNKTFEPAVTNWFIENIKSGMTVFDFGADMGYYTLIFSKLVGNNGTVYAFEPIEWAYERIKENIELNKILNVITFNFALFDSNGDAMMTNPGDQSVITTNYKNLQKNTESICIKTRIFDDIVNEKKIKKIDVVKIDCEGAELNILLGMKKTIEKFKPAFIIEIHLDKLKLFGYTEQDVHNFMEINHYRKELISRTAMEKHFCFTYL